MDKKCEMETRSKPQSKNLSSSAIIGALIGIMAFAPIWFKRRHEKSKVSFETVGQQKVQPRSFFHETNLLFQLKTKSFFPYKALFT